MSLNLNDSYSPTAAEPNTTGKIDVDQADVKAALNARTAFYAVAILSIFGSVFLGFIASGRVDDPLLLMAPMFIAGVFYVIVGYFAGKLHIWAFLVGLAVYALDTAYVIYTIFNEGGRPYSLAVKAIILYFLVKGLLAAFRLKEAVNASRL
jgi:hypothetical protein